MFSFNDLNAISMVGEGDCLSAVGKFDYSPAPVIFQQSLGRCPSLIVIIEFTRCSLYCWISAF